MYRLDEIFTILQIAHEEGMAVVYTPSENQQTAFGFGRANGILQTVQRVRQLFEAEEEQRAEKERQRDMME